MYISNSNNIGMATLLQQNKSCMKTLTNGTNGGNIIVGNVSSAPSQVTGSNVNNSNVTTAAGSIVLPVATPGTTILLTNGATGASSIISYQQYQQLLQQQHQNQVQSQATALATATRLVMPQEMVSLPITNLVSSAASNQTVNQSTVFVAANTGTHKVINTSNAANSFQQQFQQQIVSSSLNSSIGQSRLISQTANGVVHQQSQSQTNTTNTTTSTRYFAQFSQQQQQQQQQQIQPAVVNNSAGPRTILISRHQSVSGPRQQNPTIISKSVVTTNNQQTQVFRSQTIVRTATPNPNPPTVLKTVQPKTIDIKAKDKTEDVESETQQFAHVQQNHRYGVSTLQQIKLQQEKNEEQEREAIAANGIAQNENGVEKVEEKEESFEPEPEIDIVINNVVCSFSVRCHLNLREIALNGSNVEYRRENGMVTMKLRRPYTTASIWSSGRITCTGATSEVQAKIAARRYARCLEKLGFRVRFHNFRVVNVLGTCSMPWAIKIVNFSEKYKKEASYEPELHPGVTYKLRYPKATLKIFSTGSITVTAASVANVQTAIEHIYPLVYEFRKKRSPQEMEQLRLKQQAAGLHADPEVVDPETLPELIEYVPAEPDDDEDVVQHTRSPPPASPIGISTKVMKTNIRKYQAPFHPATTSQLVNHKRRRLNSSTNNQSSIFEDEYDADDPEEAIISETVDGNLDDLIEYDDDPEDLIEGPEDVIQV